VARKEELVCLHLPGREKSGVVQQRQKPEVYSVLLEYDGRMLDESQPGGASQEDLRIQSFVKDRTLCCH
jgi:hypothetical protein